MLFRSEVGQRHVLRARAPFRSGAFPGAIDEHPAHRFGCGGEECGLIDPGRLDIAAQPKPGFMDQGGGLKGETRFMRQPGCGEVPQFLEHEVEQFLAGWPPPPVPAGALDAPEDSCDEARRPPACSNPKGARGSTSGMADPLVEGRRLRSRGGLTRNAPVDETGVPRVP